MRVFADTNYWIALLNDQDSLHAAAVAASRRFRRAEIVTSQMVLVELLNAFSRGGASLRLAAAELAAQLPAARVFVHPQTEELFERAFARYRRAADKDWSLTDCASFAIMEDQGIREALTFDRHFEQAGFDALLR